LSEVEPSEHMTAELFDTVETRVEIEECMLRKCTTYDSDLFPPINCAKTSAHFSNRKPPIVNVYGAILRPDSRREYGRQR
jgi:hypothetical protein